MSLEWIFIEAFTVFIGNLAVVYFLNSRFVSKQNSRLPQILAWAALSVVGNVVILTALPGWIYYITALVLAFLFLWLCKHGAVLIKIICVVIAYALLFTTSLIGAGVASILTGVEFEYLQFTRNSPRVLTHIFVTSMQIMLLFALAKRHNPGHKVSKISTFLFLLAVVIIFAGMLITFTGVDAQSEEQNRILILISVGLLSILVIIFLLHEMFMREEAKNITLTANLQKMELESHYAEEIDAVYAEIRQWRHEYKNQLLALSGWIEKDNKKEALDYIRKLNSETAWNDNTLQTGHVILDAVASSKLSLARSLGIEIDIHAVYPEDCEIDDKDLCSIIGNLLDNSIEACQRMAEGQRKFISFSLLAKGMNMFISISNSYEGPLKKQGDRFLTVKCNIFNGIGIEYVDSIIDKYGGRVLREHANGIFDTHVMIPIKPLA